MPEVRTGRNAEADLGASTPGTAHPHIPGTDARRTGGPRRDAPISRTGSGEPEAHCRASRTTVGATSVSPPSTERRNACRSSGRRDGRGGRRTTCRSSETRRAGRPYHQTNAATGAALPPLLRISLAGHQNRLRACRAVGGCDVESLRVSRLSCASTAAPPPLHQQLAVPPRPVSPLGGHPPVWVKESKRSSPASGRGKPRPEYHDEKARP
jgi:hypothetical protein